MASVESFMSRDLLTVEPGSRLADVAKRMVSRGVGAVIVLDGERLAGILTERDLLKAFAAEAERDARVSEWMTRAPETIEPSDSSAHAASMMIHGGFRHLPVVEGGRVVGIVSIRDLMRVALADESPRGV